MSCEPRPNPSYCSNYFDCWGNSKECGVGLRFDEAAGRCRNYYLVDCGDRYNAPNYDEDDARVMCAQWAETGTGIRFPTAACNTFRQCFRDHLGNIGFANRSCETLYYDIEQAQCRVRADVDCGSRTR